MKLFKNDNQLCAKANFKFMNNFSFHVADCPRFKHDVSENPALRTHVKTYAHLNNSEIVDCPMFNDVEATSIKPFEKEEVYELGIDNFATSTSPLNLNSSFVKYSNHLNYYPNTSARRLKSKRSGLIHMSHDGHRKKNTYNSGRWTIDEHKRFIEAIIKFGNDWKNVQKYIKTRSSTQSRSHSQKFFLKLTNYNVLAFKSIKPSISSLSTLAKSFNEKELEEMLDILISCEYSEFKSECSQQQKTEDDPTKLSHKRKVTKVYDSNEADIEDSCNLSFKKPKQKKMTLRFDVSKDQTKRKSTIDEKNEEFHQQFFSVFNNQRYRRISFEDNLLMLFADCIDKQG